MLIYGNLINKRIVPKGTIENGDDLATNSLSLTGRQPFSIQFIWSFTSERYRWDLFMSGRQNKTKTSIIKSYATYTKSSGQIKCSSSLEIADS